LFWSCKSEAKIPQRRRSDSALVNAMPCHACMHASIHPLSPSLSSAFLSFVSLWGLCVCVCVRVCQIISSLIPSLLAVNAPSFSFLFCPSLLQFKAQSFLLLSFSFVCGGNSLINSKQLSEWNIDTVNIARV
jgi:predicted neutral ceramidase superfamily lipid hydrolase